MKKLSFEKNERSSYFWHPDPDEKDRKLGGPGANQRAREDRAAASKPAAKKADPKKLKPGESYMDYAKRVKNLQNLRSLLEIEERRVWVMLLLKQSVPHKVKIQNIWLL